VLETLRHKDARRLFFQDEDVQPNLSPILSLVVLHDASIIGP
jgi:hypothetical protein